MAGSFNSLIVPTLTETVADEGFLWGAKGGEANLHYYLTEFVPPANVRLFSHNLKPL